MDMKFKLIEKDEKMIEIELINTDTTLLTPIIDELNKNKDVKIVRFIETHPELENRKLRVEMKEGDPAEAIKAAAMAVSEQFGNIKL